MGDLVDLGRERAVRQHGRCVTDDPLLIDPGYPTRPAPDVGPLERVARRVEDGSLPPKSVWSALHGECQPVADGYPARVGAVFAALREEADCSQQYLGNVLRKVYADPTDLAGLLRRADTRWSESADA